MKSILEIKQSSTLNHSSSFLLYKYFSQQFDSSLTAFFKWAVQPTYIQGSGLHIHVQLVGPTAT